MSILQMQQFLVHGLDKNPDASWILRFIHKITLYITPKGNHRKGRLCLFFTIPKPDA